MEVPANEPPIILLMATLPERGVYFEKAIKSVISQSKRPTAAVIVFDGKFENSSVLNNLIASHIPTYTLNNSQPQGAANTWNLGIKFISSQWQHCYLAILDDDDLWDENHLSLCMETAQLNNWPDVVISGLRLIIDGIDQNRNPLENVQLDDFLVGNSGWQGSNTFIRFSTLLKAGCFTPNLKSCNDRDLAIRVLGIPNIRISYTYRHTASWFLVTQRNSLSRYRSAIKLEGLAHFYQLHGFRMSKVVRYQFFQRAYDLFGWSKEDIIQRAKESLYAHSSSNSF